MSGIINKVKEAIHGDKVNELPEGSRGPHNSRAANAADPRVDSDRDHRANPATGAHSAATGYNDPEGIHGPHSSRMANAADPRVDSDRDHRGAPGTMGGMGGSNTHAGHNTHTTHNTHAHTGTHGATGGAYGASGTHGTTGYNDPEGVHGPHGSRVANAADPRVDSDRDHRGAPSHAAGGYSSQGAGMGGVGAGMHSGPGPAPNTAGPHKQDMLNKVDPRVDSDLDGSKTYGGNKTMS